MGYKGEKQILGGLLVGVPLYGIYGIKGTI